MPITGWVVVGDARVRDRGGLSQWSTYLGGHHDGYGGSISTAEQERAWRAKHGAATGRPGRPAVAPCGTTAAYKRHLRRGETPCAACREAAAQTKAATRRAVTRQDRQSLALGRAVARRLVDDTDAVLAVARQNLRVMRRADSAGHAKPLLDEWDRLLEVNDTATIVSILRSMDDRSDELRKAGPFAGVIPQDERLRLFRQAR